MIAIEARPSDPRVLPLLTAHLELMRASSPACSVHAMEPAELEEAGVRFFAIFESDVAIAIGALKTVGESHGEVKSMHVRHDRRGQRLADIILVRLHEAAREAGMVRLSLETGSQEVFGAARAFYGRHGFTTCGPFGSYAPDPNSFFMTKTI